MAEVSPDVATVKKKQSSEEWIKEYPEISMNGMNHGSPGMMMIH